MGSIFGHVSLFAQFSTPCNSLPDFASPVTSDFPICNATLEVGSETSLPTATLAFPLTNICNTNILVKGTFTINKNMVFQSCIVFFDANAEMITTGNVKITSNSAFFGPCSNSTWKGITVNQFGSLVFDSGNSGDESRVDGAQNGITFKKGYKQTQSSITNTRFTRNATSIRGTDAGMVLSFVQFHSNFFDGLVALPGQANNYPQIGIQIANCSANIGAFFNFPPNYLGLGDDDLVHDIFSNRFEKLKYGIESKNAVVKVSYCSFNSMRPFNAASGPTSSGIYAEDSQLTVAPTAVSGGRVFGFSQFSNCGLAGVQALKTRLVVRYARFSLSIHEVLSKSNVAKSVVLLNNRVIFSPGTPTVTGFSIERPTGPCVIRSNDFSGTTAMGGGVGIELKCPNSTSSLMEITDNHFAMSADGNSDDFFADILIYGNQSNNIKVKRNLIESGNIEEMLSFGVFMTDCEGVGHEVSNNRSVGVLTCNFHTQRSRNIRFCNDTTNNGFNGFHFCGDDTGTDLSLNDIGSHHFGLLILDILDPLNQNISLSGGRMGDQKRKGNKWEANDALYTQFAAFCAPDPLFSKFEIEVPSTPSNKDIFPQKINPMMDWFVYATGPLQYCGAGPIRDLKPFDRAVVDGTVPPGLLSATEAWDVKRQIMLYLLKNLDLVDADPVLKNYVTQNLSSTAGKFAAIDKAFSDSTYATATDWSDLQTAYDQLDNLVQSLPESADLIQISKLDDIENLRVSTESKLNYIKQLRQTHLQSLLTQVQAIVTTHPYELGWKKLRIFKIKREMCNNTPADFTAVTALAYSNQATSGAAVRHAWYEMGDCDRFDLMKPLHEEDLSQNRPVSGRSETEKSSEPQVLSVVPNPTTGSTEVRLSPNHSGGRWMLYSTLGQQIMAGSVFLDASVIALDLKPYPAGAYHFVMILSDGKVQRQMIVVKP